MKRSDLVSGMKFFVPALSTAAADKGFLANAMGSFFPFDTIGNRIPS